MKIIIIFLFLLLNQIQCGDILIIILVPFNSYINFVNAIITTLAPNHKITLYSAVHKNFTNPNVTVHPIIKPDLNIASYGNMFTELKKNKFNAVNNQLFGMTNEYMEELLEVNRNLKDLVDTRKKYDLFFTFTHISEHLIPFAHIVQAPLVLLSPSTALPWHNEAMEIPNFFSYDYTLLIHSDSDSFLNRLKNYLSHFAFTFLYHWSYIPKISTSCAKIYPPDTPPLTNIYNNASMLLINTHEAMGYTRPTLTNAIQIGGIHCNTPKTLPDDLEEFMEGSGEHGVIYFSFGTTIKAKVPKYVTDALLNTFKKLRQRILWKWNENIEGLPSHIKIAKWFPQQDILGHNKLKLVISHGGILSIQECVYHSVPILVIPITFDQPTNAFLVQKLGYGKYIYFEDISQDKLEKEIHEMLTNKKYREKVAHVSKLMRDEPLSPSHKLNWWVDYLIRHKGYPVYRPKDNRYSWMRFIETDVLAFIIFVVVFILLFFTAIIYFIIKIFKKCSKIKKIKKM